MEGGGFREAEKPRSRQGGFRAMTALRACAWRRLEDAGDSVAEAEAV